MNRLAAFLLSLALAAGPLTAAPFLDLGEGLRYWRLPVLPAESLPAPDAPGVVDLRYTAAPGNQTPLDPLRHLLRTLPRGTLVLISPVTPAPVLEALRERPPGVLVLAAGPMRHAVVDFSIDVDPAEDRAAYDSLSQGTDVEQLIRATIEKERFDEARLVQAHERRTGSRPTPPPSGEDRTAAPPAEENDVTGEAPPALDELPVNATASDPTADPAERPAAATPLDATLRRAVQIHRGLKALGRL